MSDNLVTVASFTTPAEAQIARNMLESEGITALLADEESVGMAWYLGNALGGVKLQVPESQWMRAKVALAHHLEDFDDEEEAFGDEHENSDEHVAEKAMTSPAVGEDKVERRIAEKLMRVEPPEAGLEAPEPIEVPEGDDLAARAFRASIIGLAFPPLYLYSIWLLIQLSNWEGELSDSTSRKAWLTMVIDGVAVVFFCFLFLIWGTAGF